MCGKRYHPSFEKQSSAQYTLCQNGASLIYVYRSIGCYWFRCKEHPMPDSPNLMLLSEDEFEIASILNS